jgi:hypothetical protein
VSVCVFVCICMCVCVSVYVYKVLRNIAVRREIRHIGVVMIIRDVKETKVIGNLVLSEVLWFQNP